MAVYYNEIDPYCCAWLRALISAGHIAPGDVDERSIKDVTPHDLDGYTQCHFFAGIGGWSYALRLAGWPDTQSVWTGSCPCQPFSAAGKRLGVADARHLWPEFRRLIKECRPPTILGEQVASKDGREWLSGVRSDLEALGYAAGCADLCAASAGAPHIRQRLWWVAEPHGGLSGNGDLQRSGEYGQQSQDGEPGGLADFPSDRRQQEREDGCGIDSRGTTEGWPAGSGLRGASIRLAHCLRAGLEVGRRESGDTGSQREAAVGDCETGGLVNSARQQEGISGCAREPRGATTGGLDHSAISRRPEARQYDGGPSPLPTRPAEHGGDGGFWSDFDIVHCLDGKARRIESGTFPLAHGVPARVGKLRAYGNAIVPQVAAEFIAAYMEGLTA